MALFRGTLFLHKPPQSSAKSVMNCEFSLRRQLRLQREADSDSEPTPEKLYTNGFEWIWLGNMEVINTPTNKTEMALENPHLARRFTWTS